MSFPTIPQITPSISLNRSQVINLLLASVAFEELGLAHIINAEGEKIQASLDTRHSKCRSKHYFKRIIKINREVRRTLQTVVKSQMLLQFKLEDILDLDDKTSHCLPPHPYPRPPHPPSHCSPKPNPCPPLSSACKTCNCQCCMNQQD